MKKLNILSIRDKLCEDRFLFFPHNLAPQYLQIILKQSLLPIISDFIAIYFIIILHQNGTHEKKIPFGVIA